MSLWEEWRPEHAGGSKRRTARTRGFILIAVLWVLIALSVMAGGMTGDARVDVALARNHQTVAQAEALADAGIYRGIVELLQTSPERPVRIDGSAYAFTLGGTDIRFAIQDEGGLVDLNMANEELIGSLLVYQGLAEDAVATLVSAIADYRDPDSVRRAGDAGDGPFDSVEELHQVPGMTTELYDRIAPLLTVHSGLRGIDPEIAPFQVLAALPGMGTAEAKRLMAGRIATGITTLTPTAPERPKKGGVPLLAPGFSESANALFVRSTRSVFTIMAAAQSPTGAQFTRKAIVAIADDPRQPYVFLDWAQGRKETVEALWDEPGGEELSSR
jgi:general secretion pathway protein K